MTRLAAPLPLLALLTALPLACGGEGPKRAEPAPAVAPVHAEGPPKAHGDASGAGLPADHPPIAGGTAGPRMGGPMMGAPPPSAPVNPREVTPSGEVRDERLPELVYPVPVEWTSRPPSSSMRLAELVLPGPGGDTALVIYRFPGGAGGVEANIARWKGQFTPPEGKTIDDVSTVATDRRPPLTITRVDVRGTNSAESMPGAGDRKDEPDSRMLAAIVEGVGDPYFFKAVGPSATLDVWAPAFEAMLAGLRPAG